MMQRQKEDSTRTLLIWDLCEKLGKSPKYRDRIVKIIQRAATGFYDDYETTIACPKHQLAIDLKEAECDDLSREVVKGRYDK